MTYPEAVEIHDNTRITALRKLREAAGRILERGKPEDLPMVARLNGRAVRAERRKGQ